MKRRATTQPARDDASPSRRRSARLSKRARPADDDAAVPDAAAAVARPATETLNHSTDGAPSAPVSTLQPDNGASTAAAKDPRPTTTAASSSMSTHPGNGASVTAVATDMTADELALYDRQIRLWGLDAQSRMRQAKVLVIGMTGLSNELCKNIVLAGVGALTVVDGERVTEADLGTQFFLRTEDIGSNRADAVVPRISNLNPRVKVKAVVADASNLEQTVLEGHDIVVVTGHWPKEVLCSIDDTCRQKGIKFFCAWSFGMHGYIFSDLQDYTCSFTTKDDRGEESQKKSVYSFPSLREAQGRSLAEVRGRALKRIPAIYFALAFVWDLDGVGSQQGVEIDSPDLLLRRQQFCKRLGIDEGRLEDTAVGAVLQRPVMELTPVSAVVGGFLAQEVLSAASGKPVSIDNFFCLSADVEMVHAMPAAIGSNRVGQRRADLLSFDMDRVLSPQLPDGVDPTKMNLAVSDQKLTYYYSRFDDAHQQLHEFKDMDLHGQQQTLVFLCHLLRNPENVAPALEEGVLNVLKFNLLVLIVNKVEAECMDIQVLMLDTIYNCTRLGREPWIPGELANCSAMEIFTRIIQKEPVTEVKVAAVKCIMMLSFHKVGKEAATNSDTILVLIGLLSDRKSQVRAAAAGALMSITVDCDAKRVMVRENAISTLMDLLDDRDPAVLLNVVK
ncbi:SUMO-activating enzyme subunit 1, partial [Cladochytrium tenue]